MYRKTKLSLVGLAAALAFTALAGTASANNFSIGPGGLLTAVASELTFTEGGGEGTRIVCDVTLNASLHPTIAKVRGTLGGWIKEGATNRCSSTIGTATALILARLDRPETWWHLQYESFTGTLPDAISSVTFIVTRAAFLLRINAIITTLGCLYQGNVRAIATVVGGTTINRLAVGTETVPLITQLSGFVACPESGRLAGDPFELQTANTVRLI